MENKEFKPHQNIVLETKRYEGIDFSKFMNNLPSEQTAKEVLDMYEIKRQSKEVFSMQFPCEEKRRGLFAIDKHNTKIVMRRKEMSDVDRNVLEKNFSARSKRMTKTYNVMVTEVDYENNIVYVSHRLATEEPVRQLKEAIDAGIQKKEYVIVPATIVKVSSKIALLDIGGLGILGYVPLHEWSQSFTASLFVNAVPGQVIEVAILAIDNWKSNSTVYCCSRKQVVLKEDPWKGIEERFPKNTNACITCIQREETKFFGAIAGFSDINIFCQYPDDKSIQIMEGHTYVGYIYDVNEKKKIMRARIINEIRNDDVL